MCKFAEEYIANTNDMDIIGYFAQNLWQLWALIAVICLIMELTNGDLYVICFAIGGLCSTIVALFGLGFYGGLIVFVSCSVLSLFFVRPTLLKHLHKGEDRRVSNADAILGRVGRVSEDIEERGYGRVALDGDDWKAMSADGGFIPKGTRVRIIGRESIIITVEIEHN